MTENVILTVRGHQTDLGEDATTELIAGAAYYYRNGKHYILYDEIDPESGEQSGNTIKIGEDRVDVTDAVRARSIWYLRRRSRFLPSTIHRPESSRWRYLHPDCGQGRKGRALRQRLSMIFI